MRGGGGETRGPRRVSMLIFPTLEGGSQTRGQYERVPWYCREIRSSDADDRMPDGSIDVRDPEGAVAAMSAARRASLDQLFKQMDLDGNGTIDKREFEMAVTSATMRKFFKVIDAQISEDGEITPEEWLKGMGLIGRNMGDAEFNRLLNEMVGDLQTASATVAERNRCFGLAKCAKCFA